MSFKNLAEIIPGNADRLGDRTAYQHKKDGSYQSISFNETRDWVNRIAGGLAAIGIKSGRLCSLSAS